MNKNYQQLFREIVSILRRDYAGKELMGDRFAPRYYTQAIGQAWNDDQLDDLLFLQYVSQMLACIGDRNLAFSLRAGDGYFPHSPGFFTRRYGPDLYVTAVTSEPSVSVGDKITAINGGSPAKHKALIQKDFFRGSVPEREDWNGLLKMADTVSVSRPDGSSFDLSLAHHPLAPPELLPVCAEAAPGVVYLRPGAFEEGGNTAGFIKTNEPLLAASRALILDLRNGRGLSEDEILPILPWLCRENTPLSQLFDAELIINNTRLNCILRAAGLQGIPEAREYLQELAEKADTGFRAERCEPEGISPGMAPKTVVVLTDTWCRDAAETLALAARRAGARLIGRPTLGTTNTCIPVSYALDDRFVLSWPVALSKAAYTGHSSIGQGIAPDEYISWCPAELTDDILLKRALIYIDEN